MKPFESTQDLVQSDVFETQSIPPSGASLEARQELPVSKEGLASSKGN